MKNTQINPGIRAFTLIELLTVISIIAVLAGLTAGLTTLASRKSKEGAARAGINKLVGEIENYKAKMGFYPPDSKKPSTNQLYYELSGTVFQAVPTPAFAVPGGQEKIDPTAIGSFFTVEGFANSARAASDLKHETSFKEKEFQEINMVPDVEVLAVAVRGPATFEYADKIHPLVIKGTKGPVNPWLYDSSSTNRNNLNGYDLWCEILIGKKIVRFSNWEKDPVVHQ